jgi:hypothetical protein
MMKFAAAAAVCSAGLVFCSGTAEARCGFRKSCCKSSCCAPAATSCCAPAPTCAAPNDTAPASPAAPADAAPPAPTADVGPLTGDPAVAMSPDGQQSYRSYSADSTQPAAANPAATTPAKPKVKSNFFNANRKMMGIVR